MLKLATAGTPEIGSLDSGRSGNDGKFDVEQEKFSSIDAQGQQVGKTGIGISFAMPHINGFRGTPGRVDPVLAELSEINIAIQA